MPEKIYVERSQTTSNPETYKGINLQRFQGKGESLIVEKYAENVDSLPTWDKNRKGRLVYLTTNGQLYYSGKTGWNVLSDDTSLHGFIELLRVKRYTLMQNVDFNGTLTSFVCQSDESLANGTLQIEINGNAVVFEDGTYTISGTTETNKNISSGGSFVSGDKITMNVLTTFAVANLGFTLKYKRI